MCCNIRIKACDCAFIYMVQVLYLTFKLDPYIEICDSAILNSSLILAICVYTCFTATLPITWSFGRQQSGFLRISVAYNGKNIWCLNFSIIARNERSIVEAVNTLLSRYGQRNCYLWKRDVPIRSRFDDEQERKKDLTTEDLSIWKQRMISP